MSEVFFREAIIEQDDAAALTGNIRLSFASELPVLRNDTNGQFWEVLSHAPGDANLGFINRKGLALQDHNEKMEIGDVVPNSVKVDADKKTRGEIKLFDENWQTRAKEEWNKIPVSVGYTRLSCVSETIGEDKIPVRRYAWSPYEVSLLTVRAADSTVGINRAEIDISKTVEDKTTLTIKIMPDIQLTEPTEAQRKSISEGALTSDKARRKSIHDAAAKIIEKSPSMDAAIRKIAFEVDLEGGSVGDFSGRALEVFGAKKLDHTEAHIGMSGEEVKDYSVVRAIQSCMNSKSGQITNDCPEFDYNQQAEKRYGKRSSSFWIPTDVSVGNRAATWKKAVAT